MNLGAILILGEILANDTNFEQKYKFCLQNRKF